MKALAANAGFLLLNVAAGVVLAAAAVKLQRHFAPAVLFALLTGAAAGFIGGLTAELFGAKRKGVVWSGVILCALEAALWQHGFAYREYREKVANTKPDDPRAQLAQLAMAKFEPAPFAEYLAAEARIGRQFGPWRLRGPWTWMMWAGDLALALLGAVVAQRWLRGRTKLDAAARE